MESTNANAHLTHEERGIIETGIRNGSTKTAIAKTIGKDNSTIGKEIKLHRVLKYKCPLALECANYKVCKHDRICTESCLDYEQFVCKRRDRSPGACNGCSKYSHCRFNKYVYDPGVAQREYEELLVDSRTGFNLTQEEAKKLGETIAPLLKQGLSPYAILQIHSELKVSEKTLYTYIESGAFRGLVDIGPLDLRRQVNRKLPKHKAKLYKKREDRRFLLGRTYKDYKTYVEENPDVLVTQMDTVYNDITNGPFIQTFKFINIGLLLGLRHEKKTAEEMRKGVDKFEEILGTPLFRKHVHVLLTDRGSEFYDAVGMETDKNGLCRTRVFYCDPMQSGQKGTLENNHTELRYILPKECDLEALGLINQEALNLALSHVNSLPIEKFGGKSPLDIAEFMYPELYAKLVEFGIRKIPRNDIVLKPYLLKNWLKKQKLSSNDTSPAQTSVVVTQQETVPSPAREVQAESTNTEPSAEKSSSIKSAPHAGGRRPKESAISNEEILTLSAEGRSPKEIAQLMRVSIATYYRRLAAMK